MSTLRANTLPKRTTASSYESRYGGYVQTLFRPSPEPLDTDLFNPSPTYTQYEKRLESVKPQGSEGMIELLNAIYPKQGLDDDHPKLFNKYQVYEPKSSAEYFSVMNWKPPKESEDVDDVDLDCRPTKARTTNPNIYNHSRIYAGTYRLSPDYRRQAPAADSPYLLDYNSFKSFGHQLNPHTHSLYSRPHLVHPRDSRYVGSDFCLLNLRRPDDFFSRCDKLLDKAKKM